MSSIMKNKKVMFAVIAFILIGILPLAVKGLDFGMDFKGGTIIQVNLDMSGNETIDPQTVITVLQNRINSYGLKDVSIKPWGNPVSYIVIEIAETDPKAINELQSLLGQQGKFETLYQGKAILKGEDIVSVIVNPQQGYGVRNDAQGYRWSVPFLITSEASNTFADELLGTCSTPTAETCPELLYMFIDRPENAVILMPNEIYTNEKNIPDDLYSSSNLIPVDDLVSNSGSIELIITDEITDSVIPQITGKQVIVPKGYYPIETLELYSESVLEKEKTGDYWIVSALNLENIVHITPGIAAGTPVTRPSITGSEPTQEEAAKELNRIVILLKSGKLPVSVSVGSVSTISPSLGDEFLNYSIIAGIVAMLVVAICLFIRYKKIKIAIPILTTLVFEITMVLGVSSLIGWQMDLASVAGIIAAMGTGVDDQIIIVDEVLRKEDDDEEILNIGSRIKRAFSIVFMSAGTLSLAMAPLLFMGLGILKGFAITTIIGIIVGVFITRPAYAAIIKKII